VIDARFQTGDAFAAELDRGDPLAHFRERFHFPKTKSGGDCIYLCGHSLGLQPKTAASFIEQELHDWAQLGVDGHFHAANPWMPYHRQLTQQTAELIGAEPI
jgi:kynureninase